MMPRSRTRVTKYEFQQSVYLKDEILVFHEMSCLSSTLLPVVNGKGRGKAIRTRKYEALVLLEGQLLYSH